MNKLERMKFLVQEVNKHNYNYYVLDNPTISDKEYDALYYELVDLEKELGIILPNSPTQRVGGEVLDKFQKKRHEIRLYSLNKVRSFEDLGDFMAEMAKYEKNPTFSLEYKFDGLTVVVEYENGVFKSATTRGNGEIGEDVTEQAKTIKSIPLAIPFKGRLIVQGEGMMTMKAFKKYNKTAEIPLKNPRNGVAGAIRNLDPKETARRNLDYFCYAVLLADGKTFNTQKEMHDFIEEQGFLTGGYFKVISTLKEAEKYIEEVDEVKNSLDVMIDGMVLKLNEVAPREEIGFTNKFPKWARAFKFEAMETSTILKDVVWQVGRTGKVSPIAILEPVELAGATISRATLNNMDDIKKKGVLKNSRIFIRRSNEVIPEVLGLAEKLDNSTEIEEPSYCPCCKSKLMKKGPLLYCLNRDGCEEQIISRLTHFVSREAFNIEGLSEKTLLALNHKVGVCEFSDLYKLTSDDLRKLDNFKDKKTSNIINSINRSKEVELYRFLFALGINEVGIKTAKDLAKKFKTLSAIMKATKEELQQVDDVGEVIADNIVEYFKDRENVKEIERLFENGVSILEVEENENSLFKNMTFVLTGTLENYTRSEMSAIIEKHGGNVSSSVSKNTTYVLAGSEAGSKLDKAKSLGVKIISEKDILEMLKNAEN